MLHITSKQGKLVALFPFYVENKIQTTEAKQPIGALNSGSQAAPLAELSSLKLPLGAFLCPRGTRAPGLGLLGIHVFLWLRSEAWFHVLPTASSGLTHPPVLGMRRLLLQHKACTKSTLSPLGVGAASSFLLPCTEDG